jgi:hypothetical protein
MIARTAKQARIDITKAYKIFCINAPFLPASRFAYLALLRKKSISSFILAAVFIYLMLGPWSTVVAQESEGKIITRTELGAWHIRYE